MKSLSLLLSFVLFSILFFGCAKENNWPVISNQSFDVSEDSTPGSVVAQVVASDIDGDPLGFVILDDAETFPFIIDEVTGEIKLKESFVLDYMKQSKYEFRVRIIERIKKPHFANATITISILKGSVLPDGLVTYFPFNGDAVDESSSNNGCNVYGATLGLDRKGRENRAYSFDGVNDYMVIPHSSSLNFDGGKDSYTINIWVKSDDPANGSTNYGRLFSKWSEYKEDLYPYVILYNSTSCLSQIYHGVTNNKSIVSYPNFWDNRWHMVSFVVNGDTKTICSYLDGSKIECVANKATLNTKNNLDIIIGYCWPNSVYYKGMIDDISVYNRALSESELGTLYSY